jgi:hypothetical protein
MIDSDCCPALACDGGICKAIIPGQSYLLARPSG